MEKIKKFFKKLKIEDKVFWPIMAGILFALLFTMNSCTPYIYKSNQIKVTHVLAITELGDTVKIAMRDIQPTQVYNVVGYDFVRGYMNPYYDPWRQYHIYDHHYRYYGSNMNIGGTPNWKAPSVITNQNISGPINSGINTTGVSGAPKATNPVTATGGGKKNN